MFDWKDTMDVKLLKLILPAVLVLSGCATMTKEEADIKRAELDLMAAETIATLVEQQPELQQIIDSAEGYAVADFKLAKIPVVGAGSGKGVLVDNQRNETRYLKISRLDLGGGLGGRSYKALLVLPEREQLDDFREGKRLYSAGAELSAGSSNVEGVAGTAGYQTYVLSEGGASATATARRINISIDTQLTKMAESQTSYPALHGNLEPEGITSEEPRVWEHSLPFFAQDVIDMGFDLPLPYGIGITAVTLRQDLLLDDLEVGFNGGGTRPIKAVTFDNAEAKTTTVQIKVDAWLFPFMNVYAVLGSIDGKAPMELTIDGDEALDANGIDCSKPILNPPLCILQGKSLTVPVEAAYHGTNVGIGTVLAGGWGDYFVVLPITYIVADLNIADSRIDTLNVSPRVGKMFDLHDKGKLSVYIGATYLDVDLVIAGSLPISTPGGGATIDYKIHQTNKDKWNAVVGENWDINKYWSWTFEVGFAGSRENIITALVRRY